MNDYETTPDHMKPTKINILRELTTIVHKANALDKIFIQYSGHGSYIRDTNGDEKDGRDECLCTVDNELITDDQINSILQKLHRKCKCILLFDACHSGTNCDLPFTFNFQSKLVERNKKYTLYGKNIIYVSGCRDMETSADAYIVNNYAGAMTAYFLMALKKAGKDAKWFKVLRFLYLYLKQDGFPQNPQISVCHPRQIVENVEF